MDAAGVARGSRTGARARVATGTSRRPQLPGAEVQALRVLIVDDSPMQRFVMRTMLRKLGVIEVHEAQDGLEALERVTEGRFDVVLLDRHMPGLDGYEAAAAIAARGDAPWIAGVSADDDADDVAGAAEAGMHDYLVKPVDLGALARALGRALEARSTPR